VVEHLHGKAGVLPLNKFRFRVVQVVNELSSILAH